MSVEVCKRMNQIPAAACYDLAYLDAVERHLEVATRGTPQSK
jgi:hypothetical protein